MKAVKETIQWMVYGPERQALLSPLVVVPVSTMSATSSKCPSAEPAGYWGNIVRPKGMSRKGVRMRNIWLPI